MTKEELAIPAVKELYDQAEAILGYDLRKVRVRVNESVSVFLCVNVSVIECVSVCVNVRVQVRVRVRVYVCAETSSSPRLCSRAQRRA